VTPSLPAKFFGSPNQSPTPQSGDLRAQRPRNSAANYPVLVSAMVFAVLVVLDEFG
jgi:hypothetical protein